MLVKRCNEYYDNILSFSGDWLLQFVYRTASVQMIDIAGLEPIKWDDRRMVNVDLTEIVSVGF